MNKKLLFNALFKFVLAVLFTAFLTFLPAGTFNYWNGKLFMIILLVPMFIVGIVLMIRNPELLKKRLNNKEEQKEQGVVIKLSVVLFSVGFISAGLSFRFGWCLVPDIVSWIAAVIFLFGYLLYTEVLRENAYLSRTVEIQENQKVVDTGVYGIVRHPMYSSTILLFLSMPLVLGSFISFVIFLFYPFILVKRIRNEEKVLEEGLKGYKDYKKKVKYKVNPYIW